MPRKIEISHKTIIFATLFFLSLGLIFFLRDLILELFVGLLLMTILEPIVGKLSKFKIPRVISVLLTYILVLGTLSGVIALIIPTVVDQTASFITAFPSYLENIGVTPVISSDLLKGLTNNIGMAPGAIFQFTFSVVNNVIAILTVLVFTFYMLISRDKLEDQLGLFFGEEKKRELGEFIDTLEKKLGGWAIGELALMLAIGVTTYIGLVALGIPYALPLAILGGILEIVPFLGPIIAAIPSILIGFGISPLTGLGVAVLTFLIHEIEGYVLVPKIMEKSTGVSPLITLISLAIGARLAGVVGAIISVPVVITLQVLTKKYLVKE
ncbi:MAG TPA: AI-2E family transporter [Patescibacteria group bacterium]|nr:AI-2E family transporter [Patescibacteria group bacterium]